MGKKDAVIPSSWPKEYSTKINASNPVRIKYNDEYKLNTYFSVRWHWFVANFILFETEFLQISCLKNYFCLIDLI